MWQRSYRVFFFKQKTAYEMRISDWSSDVCSSDLDGDGAFTLVDDRIAWRNTPFARLAAGDTVLTPRIEVLHSDFLDGPARDRLRKREATWLTRHIRAQLKPLIRTPRSDERRVGNEGVSTFRSRWSPYH